jgi:hypothetical protein
MLNHGKRRNETRVNISGLRLVVVVDDAGAVLGNRGEAKLLTHILLLRLASRVEGRLLSMAADADSVAAVRLEAIRGSVVGDTVVPEGDIILAPEEADVSLLSGGNDLVEEAADGIALGLGDTDNLGDEARVVEDRLPASDRVGADERMLGDDRIPTDGATHGRGTIGLHLSRVEGSQSLEVLLHVRREDVVDSVLGRPESVTTAATGRASEDLQAGVRRRLLLVGDIGVPEERGSEHGTNVLRLLVGEDDVDILKTLLARGRGGGMLVDAAEVGTKLTLSVDVQVLLVAEEDNTTVGDQTSEIVLLGIGDLGQIDTVDLSTDLGVVVEDIRGIGQEVAEVLIAQESLVRVRLRSNGGPLDVREAWSEIFMLISLVMRLDDGTARSVVELVARRADGESLGGWHGDNSLGSVNLDGWRHCVGWRVLKKAEDGARGEM